MGIDKKFLDAEKKVSITCINLSWISNKVYAYEMLREIKLMRILDHENLISAKDIFKSESNQIYIVTDQLLECNL